VLQRANVTVPLAFMARLGLRMLRQPARGVIQDR
jgi:hypothetical protein